VHGDNINNYSINNAFIYREAISTVWCQLFDVSQGGMTELGRRTIIASLWFCSTLLIAVYSPDIGVVIDVLGSLAAIFIFVFPGKCFFVFLSCLIIYFAYFMVLFTLSTVCKILFNISISGLCLLQSTLRSDPGLYLNKHRFLIVAAFAFIVVGTFMFGVVLTQAIERFADTSKNTQRLCE
jgi:sodium-coupled neutral amino acid transporter 7/8